MFPDGFIQRIHNQKYIDSEALLKALKEPSPVSIRINPGKWNNSPLNSTNVPWCETGYYLNSRPSYTLDPLFHSGCYYPQEASVMFMEQVIKQTGVSLENIRILDLCGAPGGKSTHLSDLIGKDSLLVANEVIRSRSLILAETLTKWGSENTLVTQNDPALFGRLPGYFDVILVDAPCSGEGMFRNNIAINEWTTDNAVHCSERQKRILADVWPALKENGLLIYSTCTFNPAENEENVKWLVEKHEAECVRIDVTDFNGIIEIDFQGIYGYGFYPDKVKGEGFFISAIRKTGISKQKKINYQRQDNLKPGKADLDVVDLWTHFSKDRLLKWGDEVFAVPCDMDTYIRLFKNLKIVKPGTKIFTVKKNDYLPSHDLALSHQLKKDVFPGEDIDLDRALLYLRRDNFTLSEAPKGWNIISYRDVSIGFVNNIGSRVNNYFPIDWRIRMNVSGSVADNIIKWEGMTVISREFQIFAKPVGPVCNLNCSYCYYLGKKDLYPGKSNFHMNDEILEEYIIQHIQASTDSIINFSWHGGEPLLAGVDFYRKAVQLQRKHQPAGSIITNGIQTNAILLDNVWCKFLSEEGFIVGISIDGPAHLHDKYRRTRNDGVTLKQVLRNLERLNKHGIIPEILCVVNIDNVNYPLIVYNFIKQLGVKFISFLPLVEPQSDSPAGVSVNSVPSKEFGIFLSTIFDEWVEKDIGEIKIQIFEEAARTAFNQEHTLCIFKENCGGVPVVEHTGDFYSCDHYVDNNHLLGNIRDHSLSYFLDCDRQKAFGMAKSVTLPQYCIDCEVRPMCNGECPKNRLITAPDGEVGLNYLCKGYKHFFNHCHPFVEAISAAWKSPNP